MIKRVFFLIWVILLVLSTQNISGEVTGKAVTGDITKNVGLRINIISSTFTLNLISPKNDTYWTKNNLLLNFTASGQQSVWYNLDNGANTTIDTTTFFNSSEGAHLFNIFANSSNGSIIQRNSTFGIRTNIINLSYSKYREKGNTTKLENYGFAELQNLSNLTLQNTSVGKIFFTSPVNLTKDANFTEQTYIIDINDYVNIEFNKIEVKTEYFQGLNSSATLEIDNLTFTNPRLLMEGKVCPISICLIQSYSNGTLIFNVQHFTAYSSEETPSSESSSSSSTSSSSSSSSSSSGGGGGGYISETTKKKKPALIILSPETMSIGLKQGEVKQSILTIENQGEEASNLVINTNKINDFVLMRENNFTLNPGEKRQIAINFLAEENIKPGIYVGEIVIMHNKEKERIPVAININQKKALFDVSVEISKKFLRVSAGSDLVASIKITNLGNIGKVDASLTYTISNENGDIIKEEQESIAVETQAGVIKTIAIPSYVKEGRYLIIVKTEYNGNIATASEWFTVTKEETSNPNTAITAIVLIILLLAIISSVYVIIFRARKRKTELPEKKKTVGKPKVEVYYE